MPPNSDQAVNTSRSDSRELPWDSRFPQRAAEWQLKDRRLTFSRLPLLMGIVNVTPDSFSDGGNFYDVGAAVEHALQLADQGADILDIGGESTRPYADPVSTAEELRRVVSVVERVCSQVAIPVSIDTSKSAVARACIDAGAEIINDVTGLEGDATMVDLAVERGVGVLAMHMRGIPQTMQDDPAYQDVVAEIRDYLAARRDRLVDRGVKRSSLCLDPGIGFGKTHQHNLTLMANCYQFHSLGCPLLVGHSRKGFLGKILGDEKADRTAATLGSAVALASQGVQLIRVHDVRPIREALLAYQAVGGIDGHAKILS